MKPSPPVCALLSWASLALAASDSSTSTFEPADFDVSAALGNLGFDISNIPQVSPSVITSQCAAACTALERHFTTEDASSASTISHSNSANYTDFTSAYWSTNQAEVSPHCIFTPSSPAAIQILVLLARHTGCPFAVKSGGHAAFPGASSIQGGITVSLEKLRSILLSEDKKLATVGAGTLALQVYETLQPHNVTVMAGRGATIGVGGFLTGGGISFFSSRYGLACDRVASFEVVTAQGTLISATPTTHPTLYRALRGGGNNFGIVTSFTLETIPLPLGALWAQAKIYSNWWSAPKIIDAYADAVAASDQDVDAGLWVAWVKFHGVRLASVQMWHGRPLEVDSSSDANAPEEIVDNDNSNSNSSLYTPSTSPVFAKIHALSSLINQDCALSSSKSPNTTDYCQTHALLSRKVEATNHYGTRQCYYQMTTFADPRILTLSHAIFFQHIEALNGVRGALPSMVWQAFTPAQLRLMERNGGNALLRKRDKKGSGKRGFNAEDGPYYNLLVTMDWKNPKDDFLVHKTLSGILKEISAVVENLLGKENVVDLVYMNYASQWQDVIASYGDENKAWLKEVASEYDPRGIFQTLQPGYFKLDRAPVVNELLFSYPSAKTEENLFVDSSQPDAKDEL